MIFVLFGAAFVILSVETFYPESISGLVIGFFQPLIQLCYDLGACVARYLSIFWYIEWFRFFSYVKRYFDAAGRLFRALWSVVEAGVAFCRGFFSEWYVIGTLGLLFLVVARFFQVQLVDWAYSTGHVVYETGSKIYGTGPIEWFVNLPDRIKAFTVVATFVVVMLMTVVALGYSERDEIKEPVRRRRRRPAQPSRRSARLLAQEANNE